MNSFERNKKQKSKNTVSHISPSTLEFKFDNFELSVKLLRGLNGDLKIRFLKSSLDF